MKTIKLTPFINFSKFLALMNNNQKLQIHDTTKQKIVNSRAEFPIKMYDSVSKNSVQKSARARNLPKPSLNLPVPEICQINP